MALAKPDRRDRLRGVVYTLLTVLCLSLSSLSYGFSLIAVDEPIRFYEETETTVRLRAEIAITSNNPNNIRNLAAYFYWLGTEPVQSRVLLSSKDSSQNINDLPLRTGQFVNFSLQGTGRCRTISDVCSLYLIIEIDKSVIASYSDARSWIDLYIRSRDANLSDRHIRLRVEYPKFEKAIRLSGLRDVHFSQSQFENTPNSYIEDRFTACVESNYRGTYTLTADSRNVVGGEQLFLRSGAGDTVRYYMTINGYGFNGERSLRLNASGASGCGEQNQLDFGLFIYRNWVSQATEDTYSDQMTITVSVE
ncbi:hypothetical protein PAHA111176_00990 [Parendozoicomonas haliclonae]|uniref:Uncharacterized protein n=1 Tax=Parendozoicomonas haliclonae TaxID=1960125 RepID=A0A1X7AG54_9GAMM|nr:hypothetical protein EHSB41UT_01003 [Parendozoicomonas haliclonae]